MRGITDGIIAFTCLLRAEGYCTVILPKHLLHLNTSILMGGISGGQHPLLVTEWWPENNLIINCDFVWASILQWTGVLSVGRTDGRIWSLCMKLTHQWSSPHRFFWCYTSLLPVCRILMRRPSTEANMIECNVRIIGSELTVDFRRTGNTSHLVKFQSLCHGSAGGR